MPKESNKELSKQKKYSLLFLAVAVIAIILLLVLRSNEKDADNGFTINQTIEVSGLELINNKEKYENAEVKIMNILVSDPLFAYVEFPEGGGERLFIEPRKTDYCLHFNLLGTLQKDDRRYWIFNVSEFECISTN